MHTGVFVKSIVRRSVIFCAAAVLVWVGMSLPLPEGMPEAARACIVDLAFLIILWAGKVVPKPVAAILATMMLYWLGAVDSFSTALELFVSDIFFFLLAAFAIAAAVGKSPLPHRLLVWFIRHSRNSAKLLILAFMVITAVISTVISDLAACALFASILNPMLKRMPQSDKEAGNFSKCVMMGIPMAALAGGIMTPIGSPSNITLLGLLRDSTQVDVSFLGWMVVGVPWGMLCLALSWAALCVFFKPRITGDMAEAFHMDLGREVKMTAPEVKLVVFMMGIFALWIVQGVTGILSSTQVAIIGMAILFLPGMDLLDWKSYAEETPWDLVIMLGGVIAIGRALTSAGAIDWVVNTLLVGASGWSPLLYLAAVSAFIIIERAFVPMAPPVTIAISPVFMVIALQLGLPPLCICLAVSTWCQITFLIPMFDACWLITYAEGYYSLKDVVRFGWLLSLVLLGLSLVLLPALSNVASVLP